MAREVNPMVPCPTCHAMVAPGTRWCTNCRSNVQDPSLGKLASPGRRLAANVIDLFLLSLAIGALGVGATGGGERLDGRIGTIFFGLFIAYLVSVIVLFTRGTTPGKRILGLSVIKENGQRAGFGKMLYREWIWKSVEGLPGLLLLVASGLMMFTDKDHQALHDKVVHTYVVRMKG